MNTQKGTFARIRSGGGTHRKLAPIPGPFRNCVSWFVSARPIVLGAALLAASQPQVQAAAARQGEVFETSFHSTRPYTNAFTQIEVDVVFTHGRQDWRMPAFWAGGDRWTVRFAPPAEGGYAYKVTCSDSSNAGLNGQEQSLVVKSYSGTNPLYRHGMLRVSADQRHFEHADGTPFFWLGDTWWKGLAKRLTWEGFQELTADRKAKGFSVVQIVCGPYPDEGPFQERWENEGGKPYQTTDFSVLNPAYFDYADRRIRHLCEQGIVPAIVGGWGRSDCDGMRLAGVIGMKRHWRNLVARYGAYPTIWIIGGESSGPQWTEVARYVQQIDPYHRPATIHPGTSARDSVTDESVISFDMLQTGHGDWSAAQGAIPKLKAAYARNPVMPAMVGEYCYEGHMQTAFQDVQRYVFWGCLLNGAAGLTYGAAGVWHASVEGDPGITPVYDLTTWKEGMNYPGSTQLGLGRQLLAQYPWARFAPHPEWTEPDCFAAGIPGEVRFIYQPRRGVYNWSGTTVKGLEPEVPYHVFYFNPANAKRYDLGTIVRSGPAPLPFGEPVQPLLFADRFDGPAAGAWKDYGTTSQRQGGALIGGKGLLTLLETPTGTNLMARVEAKSDAEAGIVLRFHGTNEYLVALYSPSLKAMYIHDRKNGQWGPELGRVEVPEIGPSIRLTAGVCGDYAALVLSDGTRTYATRTVRVSNTTPGKTGLWLYQLGDRQEYRNFELSRAQFAPTVVPAGEGRAFVASDPYKTPGVPSPQDWVLVLERVRQ